jgi:hypothetical protein
MDFIDPIEQQKKKITPIAETATTEQVSQKSINAFIDPIEVNNKKTNEPVVSPTPGLSPSGGGIGEKLKDFGASLVKGAVYGIPTTAIGLADILTTFTTMGQVRPEQGIGKGIDTALESAGLPNIKEIGQKLDESLYSKNLLAAKERVAKASEEGFIPTLKQAIKEPEFIATTIGENLPSMYGGSALSGKLFGVGVKGLSSAEKLSRATKAGSFAEGALTAGQNVESVREDSPTGTITPEQIGINTVAGALTSLIGYGGGKIAAKLGLDDINTAMAGSFNKSSRGGIIKKLIGSAIQEGVLEELPQSMQEQMMQNLSQDKPLLEGVGGQGAIGLITGAAQGSGINLIGDVKRKVFPQKGIPLDLLKGTSVDLQDLESVVNSAKQIPPIENGVKDIKTGSQTESEAVLAKLLNEQSSTKEDDINNLLNELYEQFQSQQPKEMAAIAGMDYSKEAKDAGVIYNGLQEHPNGYQIPLFTDPETGSTFAQLENETVSDALKRSRTNFYRESGTTVADQLRTVQEQENVNAESNKENTLRVAKNVFGEEVEGSKPNGTHLAYNVIREASKNMGGKDTNQIFVNKDSKIFDSTTRLFNVLKTISTQRLSDNSLDDAQKDTIKTWKDRGITRQTVGKFGDNGYSVLYGNNQALIIEKNQGVYNVRVESNFGRPTVPTKLEGAKFDEQGKMISYTTPEEKQASAKNAQTEPKSINIVKYGFGQALPEGVIDGHRYEGKTILNAKPGERGALGNPYIANDVKGGTLTREEATKKFEQAFLNRVNTDQAYRDWVLSLKGKDIGYYKPDEKDIHLNAVKNWLESNPSEKIPEKKTTSWEALINAQTDPAAKQKIKFLQAKNKAGQMTKEESIWLKETARKTFEVKQEEKWSSLGTGNFSEEKKQQLRTLGHSNNTISKMNEVAADELIKNKVKSPELIKREGLSASESNKRVIQILNELYAEEVKPQKILHPISKVISGAQTGVDMAGLDAAKSAGLQTGGTAAAYFTQSISPKKSIRNPELAKLYGLKEGESIHKVGKFGAYEDVYHKRTIANAQEADGTVWFGDPNSPGGRLTLGYGAQHGKPDPLVNPKSAKEIAEWAIKNKVKTLNVAGNREHTNPGIYKTANDMLSELFGGIPNGERKGTTGGQQVQTSSKESKEVQKEKQEEIKIVHEGKTYVATKHRLGFNRMTNLENFGTTGAENVMTASGYWGWKGENGEMVPASLAHILDAKQREQFFSKEETKTVDDIQYSGRSIVTDKTRITLPVDFNDPRAIVRVDFKDGGHETFKVYKTDDVATDLDNISKTIAYTIAAEHEFDDVKTLQNVRDNLNLKEITGVETKLDIKESATTAFLKNLSAKPEKMNEKDAKHYQSELNHMADGWDQRNPSDTPTKYTLSKAPTKEAHALANYLTNLFGAEIVFYDSNKPSTAGLYMDGVVYVNASSWKASNLSGIMHTTGHEIGHFIQKNYPELYKDIVNFIAKNPNANSYLENYMKTMKYTDPKKALVEMTNDIIGRGIMDKEFWNNLKDHNVSLFKRFATTVRQLILDARHTLSNLIAQSPKMKLLETLHNDLTKTSDDLYRMLATIPNSRLQLFQEMATADDFINRSEAPKAQNVTEMYGDKVQEHEGMLKLIDMQTNDQIDNLETPVVRKLTSDVNNEFLAIAQKIGQLFNVPVAFYKQTGGNYSSDDGLTQHTYTTLGVMSPANETLYLNADAINFKNKSYAVQVVGHELGHWLENKYPKIYNEIRYYILKRGGDHYKEFKKFVESNILAKTYTDEKSIMDEFISDIIGRHFLDVNFWNKMFVDDPRLMVKVGDKFIAALNKMRDAFEEIMKRPGYERLQYTGEIYRNVVAVDRFIENKLLQIRKEVREAEEAHQAEQELKDSIEEKNNIEHLTKEVEKVTSPKDPSKFIFKKTQEVVNMSKDLKTTITQTINSLRAGFVGLLHAWRHPPNITQYKEFFGEYLFARAKYSYLSAQFAKAIVKQIPSKLRREGIVNWIQAGGDTAVLQQRLADSKDRYKPGYQAALDLNETEKEFARQINKYFVEKLAIGIQQGMLKNGVANYISQLYKYESKKVTDPVINGIVSEAENNMLKRNPYLLQKRIFQSYFEAEQKGKTPRNKDIGFLISTYDQAFNEALAARTFLKNMYEKGTIKDKWGDRPMIWIEAGGKMLPLSELPKSEGNFLVPRTDISKDVYTGDYHEVDHPTMRGWRWIVADPDGKPQLVEGKLMVHPDIYKSAIGEPDLKSLLGKSRLESWTPTRGALKVSRELKATLLSMSFFHQVQEGVHAIFHKVSPAWYGEVKSLITRDKSDRSLPEIDFDDPVTTSLIKRGLMISDYNGAAQFSEGVHSSGLINKMPLIGPYLQKYNEYLFTSYIPRLKVAMAKGALVRNRHDYAGKLTDAQILEMTAEQANAAFGELNYHMLGRSKTVQDILRLSLLAPDFLEARARFTTQASSWMIGGYGKEQFMALVFRGAAGLYIGGMILNMLFNGGDPKWDEPFTFVWGNKTYALRSVPGDIWHLIKDPRSFIYHRLNPTITRTAIEALTARDQFGKRRTLNEQAKDFIVTHTPIPAQGLIKSRDRNVFDSVLNSMGLSTYKNKTHAEKLINENMVRVEDPNENKQVKRLHRLLVESLRMDGEIPQEIEEAKANRIIDYEQIQRWKKEARRPELAVLFSHINNWDAVDKIWNAATDEEKEILGKIYREKKFHMRNRRPLEEE